MGFINEYGNIKYIVERGQNLAKIASELVLRRNEKIGEGQLADVKEDFRDTDNYKVRQAIAKSLAKSNNISDPNKIKIDQVIDVPDRFDVETFDQSIFASPVQATERQGNSSKPNFILSKQGGNVLLAVPEGGDNWLQVAIFLRDNRGENNLIDLKGLKEGESIQPLLKGFYGEVPPEAGSQLNLTDFFRAVNKDGRVKGKVERQASTEQTAPETKNRSNIVEPFSDDTRLARFDQPVLSSGQNPNNAVTKKLTATVQHRLEQRGLYRGPVNGIFDEATKAAVIKFQNFVGTDADGSVGRLTYAQLDQAPPQPILSNGKKASILISLKDEKLLVYNKQGEPVFQCAIGWSREDRTDERWGRTGTGERKIAEVLRRSEGQLDEIEAKLRWDKGAFGDILFDLKDIDGSDVYDELHGSGDPRGSSHGCMRVRNSDIREITRLLGEPTGKFIKIVNDLR